MEAENMLRGFKDPRALAGLPPDTPLAVAFSGGADSVALLSLLADSGPVYALHVHHNIRGAEADRDADFCRRAAAAAGVPFTLLAVDAPARAKEQGESVETAARNARYEAMSAWMRDAGVPLLATAHHANDQLETMLQHLLRGSGTRGLGGIPACRPLAEGLWVVRPLLQIPKAELLHYVEMHSLPFVSDSTNGELCCQRNFLRLRVLPLLEELQPGAAASAARCAEMLAEDEAYLDALAANFLMREGDNPGVEALRALPAPIFARVIRRLLPKAPEAVHIAALRKLLDSEKPHAALSLPGAEAKLHRGHLSIVTAPPAPFTDYELTLRAGRNRDPAASVLILVGEEATAEERAAYPYAAELQLDSSIIKGRLLARPRRPGDKILCGGMHKAVRRLSALSRFTPEERARIPLLADDDGILAVPFALTRDGNRKKDLSVIILFH